MTGYVTPRCECGHTPAAHASSGASLYAGPRGRCRSCDCKEFREVKPDEKEAA